MALRGVPPPQAEPTPLYPLTMRSEDTPQQPRKLHEALSPEEIEETPLCLLLSTRHPHPFTEYPMAFLLALELPDTVEQRYQRYQKLG